MEKETHITACSGKEVEVQCPVCGADTHVSARSPVEHSPHIFRKIHDSLYHQRTCHGCYFSFSRLIVGEVLWALVEPYLTSFFPRRRRIRSFGNLDLPAHVPTARIGQGMANIRPPQKMVPHSTVGLDGDMPFLVDPVKRTVSINLQCSIGKGEFGSEMMSAASSLENHLRLAADQIRALVENASALPVKKMASSTGGSDAGAEADPTAPLLS